MIAKRETDEEAQRADDRLPENVELELVPRSEVEAAEFAVHRVHRWHTGQKKVERPPCTMRRIVPRQPCVGQGSPARS
jgi:hypothetical protein